MAIMNCRKMPAYVVYRRFRSCGQRLKPGEENRSNIFKKTNNLQDNNGQSSPSSSRSLVSVPKPSTESSKRLRCSEDDYKAVSVKGLERKGSKRQRTYTDIEDVRIGNLGSKKVDGALGLRRSSETWSSTYSWNRPVCHVHAFPPVKSTICDENEMNLIPETGSRVAQLLARFGDIIVKAQRDINGAAKRLGTTEAKIARLRNAETNRAKELVMQQRQQDREAARLALDEMERNADIEDNFKVMKEIQTLLSGQQQIEFRKYFRLIQ